MGKNVIFSFSCLWRFFPRHLFAKHIYNGVFVCVSNTCWNITLELFKHSHTPSSTKIACNAHTRGWAEPSFFKSCRFGYYLLWFIRCHQHWWVISIQWFIYCHFASMFISRSYFYSFVHSFFLVLFVLFVVDVSALCGWCSSASPPHSVRCRL